MNESNPFEPPAVRVADPVQSMHTQLLGPKNVGAGHGWVWIRDGFGLFASAPLIWVVITIILFAIMMLLSLVPVISLLANILSPVFAGGLMLGCRALDSGRDLSIAHLFKGFSRNTASLVAVGGLYLSGVLLSMALAALLFYLIGGEAFANVVQNVGMGGPPEAHLAGLIVPLLMVALLMLALVLPMVMAVWFAPALVVFHDLGAIEAMKKSFLGCLRNVMPFLLYGVIASLLILLGMIPLGLGLLVVIPVLMASVYVSYKDIFLGSV